MYRKHDIILARKTVVVLLEILINNSTEDDKFRVIYTEERLCRNHAFIGRAVRVRERNSNFPIIVIQHDYMAVKTSSDESLLKEQLENKCFLVEDLLRMNRHSALNF